MPASRTRSVTCSVWSSRSIRPPARTRRPRAAAELRPGLINEVRLDGLQHVLPAAGLGWVVTEPATTTVSLLDHGLRPVRRVSLPFAVPRLNVSATSRWIAIADRDELV